jgi:hypothetical protein
MGVFALCSPISQAQSSYSPGMNFSGVNNQTRPKADSEDDQEWVQNLTIDVQFSFNF